MLGKNNILFLLIFLHYYAFTITNVHFTYNRTSTLQIRFQHAKRMNSKNYQRIKMQIKSRKRSKNHEIYTKGGV